MVSNLPTSLWNGFVTNNKLINHETIPKVWGENRHFNLDAAVQSTVLASATKHSLPNYHSASLSPGRRFEDVVTVFCQHLLERPQVERSAAGDLAITLTPMWRAATNVRSFRE
jgi:hypothetical protein